MIKFFRKIRQNLILENKTGKYLKYAIGEIALVVIGILIALQINNWNDQYMRANEEKELLKDLIKDIDQDIETLEYTLERDSIFIVSNKIILSAFKNDSILKDSLAFAQTAVNSSFFQSFNPTNTVFNSMQSTGKLSYIFSDLIRKEIQSYYDYSAYVVEGDQINLDVIVSYNLKMRSDIDGNSLSQAILPEFARYELDKLDLSFFSKPITSPEVKEFANDLTSKQMLMYGLNRGHKKLLARAKKLKRDITNYLIDK